jgi:hypothetical protein
MAYLIGRAFHWFGGRVSTRARRMPVYLDDHTLRDIGLTRMEYHFLHMSGPATRTMRAAPIKRSARSHAVGEDRSSPSRIGLDLVWNNPN